jgi:outer membrane protein insertion porin family
VVTTKSGSVFDSTAVEKSVEELTIALANRGYSFAQVRPRGDRDYANHTIAITYMIDEGPRVYVERIDIHGNTKTRDYVIRREFDLSEGDAYNRVLVDKAERRLRALDYFTTVSVTTEPGSAPDKVIINVLVDEKSTGSFAISAGVSTTDGFIAEVSMNETNFLGRGQYLKLAVGSGSDDKTYTMAFTDPYFLGTHMAFGIDAYRNTSSSSTTRPFDTQTTGGGLRLGLPITDQWTVTYNYRLFQDSVSDHTNCGTYAQNCYYFPDGDTITSSLGYQSVYSTIDSMQDPHEGVYVKFSQDFAGAGGDTKYVRSAFDSRVYREAGDTGIVSMVRVQGGNITGLGGADVRVADNFFKGGETVRGFESLGWGPRDLNSDLALGGKTYVAATAEVQFPLPMMPPDFGLRGAVFADAGTMWGVDIPAGCATCTNIADDQTIRSSVGLSLLWASPFGALRADFSQVLSKASYDKPQLFRISAGTQF